MGFNPLSLTKTDLGDFTPEVLATLNDETLFNLLGQQHAFMESNAGLVTMVASELCKLSNLEREAERRQATTAEPEAVAA